MTATRSDKRALSVVGWGDVLACYTLPSMAEVHIELLRRAGPARRAALAIRLSSSMIRASRRAVARRHPELDEVLLRWAELHHGPTIAAAVRERPGCLDG